MSLILKLYHPQSNHDEVASTTPKAVSVLAPLYIFRDGHVQCISKRAGCDRYFPETRRYMPWWWWLTRRKFFHRSTAGAGSRLGNLQEGQAAADNLMSG
jgi:hypothetical protein